MAASPGSGLRRRPPPCAWRRVRGGAEPPSRSRLWAGARARRGEGPGASWGPWGSRRRPPLLVTLLEGEVIVPIVSPRAERGARGGGGGHGRPPGLEEPGNPEWVPLGPGAANAVCREELPPSASLGGPRGPLGRRRAPAARQRRRAGGLGTLALELAGHRETRQRERSASSSQASGAPRAHRSYPSP